MSSLDYQIQKDKERLADIQERIEAEQVRYEPAHEVHKTMAEIEGMGQKTITGKIAVSKDTIISSSRRLPRRVSQAAEKSKI